MRAWLGIGLSAALVVVSCSCAMTSMTMHRSQPSAAVVLITIHCADGGMGWGSGFAVSPTRIITAGHVANACIGNKLTVTVGDQELNARIAAVSETADAAALELEGGRMDSWFEMANSVPAEGDRVCEIAADHMEGMKLKKCGYVAGPDATYIVVSMKSVPGNSGCPVLDASGRVVGILVRGRWGETVDNVSLVQPLASWRDLLA